MLAEAVPLADVPAPSAAPQQSDEVPVPPQYQQARVNDFRGAGFAPKGYKQNAVKTGSSKRKLDEYQQQVHLSASTSSTSVQAVGVTLLTYVYLQAQVDHDEAEMKTDNPAPISFKKLKTTKSDTSGVGKVHICCVTFCKHARPAVLGLWPAGLGL